MKGKWKGGGIGGADAGGNDRGLACVYLGCIKVDEVVQHSGLVIGADICSGITQHVIVYVHH